MAAPITTTSVSYINQVTHESLSPFSKKEPGKCSSWLFVFHMPECSRVSVRSALSSLFQAVFFLVSAVLYCCGRQEYLGFLVLCLAFSWVNLLYFSRGFENMGIYSVMIQTVHCTQTTHHSHSYCMTHCQIKGHVCVTGSPITWLSCSVLTRIH